MKKSAVVSALLVFSLAAAACGSDEDSSSTLKVGYAADLSDLGGFADMPASQAGEHFVALVNCAGGIGNGPERLRRVIGYEARMDDGEHRG